MKANAVFTPHLHHEKNISNVKICSVTACPIATSPIYSRLTPDIKPRTGMSTYSGNYPDIKPAYDLSCSDQVDQ
jgi:hypothetical protein